VGDGAIVGGAVRGAIGGTVWGAMPDTRQCAVRSRVVREGMAGMGWGGGGGDTMKALARGPGRGPRMLWLAGCGMGHI
jgi:hypothetical protein